MVLLLDSSNKYFSRDFNSFLDIKREEDDDVEKVVSDIINNVRKRGDQSLYEYSLTLDKFGLTSDNIQVSRSEIEQSVEECNNHDLEALNLAAARIRAFHLKQLPKDISYIDHAGVQLGMRWNAIESVGMYVPGGLASYPSSVLMNAIPAKVAGVGRLVMVSPASSGDINPIILAAAGVVGVDEIYRVGGAHSIAALAHGCESIDPVDKIVGPGNAFVTAAKRQLFGLVGIDMVAGPSEILVLSDNRNDPNWIASDLLSQAEHDITAQAILITDDVRFGKQVCESIENMMSILPRKDIIRESWEKYGAVIVVDELPQAVELINRIAPEHLELAIDEPEIFAKNIINAGAIFLGRYTPEALGDYVGGPSHVLPTRRSSRFASGLGVYDFMKRTTFLGVSSDSIKNIGPDAVTLAEAEGLEAHALSVRLRLNDQNVG